jgi:hypothetical protein
MRLPIGDKLRIYRDTLRRRRRPVPFLPPHATRATGCRTLALEHEGLRLALAREPSCGRHLMRVDWLLQSVFLRPRPADSRRAAY